MSVAVSAVAPFEFLAAAAGAGIVTAYRTHLTGRDNVRPNDPDLAPP